MKNYKGEPIQPWQEKYYKAMETDPDFKTFVDNVTNKMIEGFVKDSKILHPKEDVAKNLVDLHIDAIYQSYKDGLSVEKTAFCTLII